jgi:hypothetical protein
MACVEAMGCLTRLTYLNLSVNQLTPQGLMRLTGLSCLQELHWMDDACTPAEASDVRKEHVDAFWAAVRGQVHQ